MRRGTVAALAALACLLTACSSAPAEVASTSRQTTTTVLPASFEVGVHLFHFVDSAPGVTHIGPNGEPVPGRVLTTEVRYPTLAGSPRGEVVDAPPARAGAPYPVIVFAHGFITMPSYYAPLLDAWVRAGFVVVAPRFPDENAEAVVAAGGGDDELVRHNLESDEFSEPGDLVYVLRQLGSLSAQPWGSHLSGVMNLSDLALAGQSDGADVVAALGFASGFSSLRSQLPASPKAVAVLAGAPWSSTLTGTAGTYRGGPGSPALLQVQSDADGCNLPAEALLLWHDLEGSLESKWFVTLFGAAHLPPFEGYRPWAPAVEAVTTRFFELELSWRSAALRPSSVTAAATASGVARADTGPVVDMPSVAPVGGCPV